MEKGQLGNILKVTFIFVVLAAFVLAEQEETTMTWVVPTSVAHGLAYGGACDDLNFFFVVNSSTGNGGMWGSGCTGGTGPYACENATVPRADSAGSTACQGASTDGITITNDGNAAINISTQMYLAQTNITLKVTLNNSSPAGCGANGNATWEYSCSAAWGGPAQTTKCINVTSTENLIIKDLNVSQSQGTCWYSDFGGSITATNNTNVSTYAEVTP